MTVYLPHCFEASMIHIYYLGYSSDVNLNVTQKRQDWGRLDPEKRPKLIQCEVNS